MMAAAQKIWEAYVGAMKAPGAGVMAEKMENNGDLQIAARK